MGILIQSEPACHTCRSRSAIFSWSAWWRFNINFWQKVAWEERFFFNLVAFFACKLKVRVLIFLLTEGIVQWKRTCSSKLADLRFSLSSRRWRSLVSSLCRCSSSSEQWRSSSVIFRLTFSVCSCCLSSSTSLSFSSHLHINWSVMYLTLILTFSDYKQDYIIYFFSSRHTTFGLLSVSAGSCRHAPRAPPARLWLHVTVFHSAPASGLFAPSLWWEAEDENEKWKRGGNYALTYTVLDSRYSLTHATCSNKIYDFDSALQAADSIIVGYSRAILIS